MIERFFHVLKELAYLSDEDLQGIASLCSIEKLQVGDFWFQEGMFLHKVAFIYEGYLRKYYLKDGKEKTDFFYFENNFTGDLPSIISNSACQSYNVAMEESTLVTLSYRKLNELAKKSYNIEHLLRLITEKGFVTYYNKGLSFILQSPKQRYEALMRGHPEILKRATQYHIASYLGITPQHLSRLRAAK